jgi:hypothetical protein
MYAFAAKEALSCMSRSPGLSHKLPKRITSRPRDESSIGSPSFGRLLPLVLDGPGVFESAYLLAFLRSSLDLFPGKDKGCHRFNGVSQQQSGWR